MGTHPRHAVPISITKQGAPKTHLLVQQAHLVGDNLLLSSPAVFQALYTQETKSSPQPNTPDQCCCSRLTMGRYSAGLLSSWLPSSRSNILTSWRSTRSLLLPPVVRASLHRQACDLTTHVKVMQAAPEAWLRHAGGQEP